MILLQFLGAVDEQLSDDLINFTLHEMITAP